MGSPETRRQREAGEQNEAQRQRHGEFMPRKPCRKIRQGGALQGRRHGEPRRHIGAHRHEGGVAEGHHARIAAEDLEGQNGAEIDAIERHEPLAGKAHNERHRRP